MGGVRGWWGVGRDGGGGRVGDGVWVPVVGFRRMWRHKGAPLLPFSLSLSL